MTRLQRDADRCGYSPSCEPKRMPHLSALPLAGHATYFRPSVGYSYHIWGCADNYIYCSPYTGCALHPRELRFESPTHRQRRMIERSSFLFIYLHTPDYYTYARDRSQRDNARKCLSIMDAGTHADGHTLQETERFPSCENQPQKGR